MSLARVGLAACLAVALACNEPGGPPPSGGGVDQTATLEVSVEGAGDVEVSGGEAASHCRGNCAVTAAAGASVKLVAHPDDGQVFAGWSGACGGTGDCSLALSGTLAVTARFELAPPPPPPPPPPTVKHAASAQRAGDGDGRVTSAPGGIDCGTACRAEFTDGTQVTFTAAAAAGSRFDGWDGACSGTGVCSVKLDRDVTLVARFAKAPPPPRYDLAEIAIPGGMAVGQGMNGFGDVVGFFAPDGDVPRPFFHEARSRTTTFLPPTDRSAVAIAVNDSGEVAIDDTTMNQVLRWSGGRLEPIPAPGDAHAGSINALGWIAGWTILPDGAGSRGILNDRRSTVVLDVLAGGASSMASAVNGRGVVVGGSDGTAVRWEGSTAVRLPVREGAFARDVNEAGVVVGAANDVARGNQAFVLDLAAVKVTYVSPIGDDTGVTFAAVNASGTAVGTGFARDGTTRAVVHAAGKLEDLNGLVADPGYRLTIGRGVNDRGQILVQGEDATGRWHSAVLTPRKP
jgi:hypothetical protein